MTMAPSIYDGKDVNTMPPLDEAYFVWLYSQVGSVKIRNKAKSYWQLMKLLHQKEFTWSIPLDENRAHDGMDLRRRFLDEMGMACDDSAWLDMGCSMLELLVALAKKLAWEMEVLDESGWFWQLIDNLGLTECTDAYPPNPTVVDHVLDRIIHRDYLPNGDSGLFPLINPNEDQREVELWYQAQAYLLERL